MDVNGFPGMKLIVFLMTCSWLSGCQSASEATTQKAGWTDKKLAVLQDNSTSDVQASVALADSGQGNSEATQAVLNEELANGPDISHRYKYKVRGKQYRVFSTADNFQEIGSASWYGPGFHGKKTANGEIYNMHAMTAAHKTLPLGSKVQVTNLSNGKKITVRINDRGPFHGGRIIDLSKKAAKALGILHKGHGKVHIKIVN